MTETQNQDKPTSAAGPVQPLVMARYLHILQHSKGLDQYGQGTHYRNRFVTGPGSDNYDDCQALVAQGLMEDHGAYGMFAGDHVFTVTREGNDYIKAHSPKPPKLTRGQKRYREYLKVSDCFESFGDYLKQQAQEARNLA